MRLPPSGPGRSGIPENVLRRSRLGREAFQLAEMARLPERAMVPSRAMALRASSWARQVLIERVVPSVVARRSRVWTGMPAAESWRPEREDSMERIWPLASEAVAVPESDPVRGGVVGNHAARSGESILMLAVSGDLATSGHAGGSWPLAVPARWLGPVPRSVSFRSQRPAARLAEAARRATVNLSWWRLPPDRVSELLRACGEVGGPDSETVRASACHASPWVGGSHGARARLERRVAERLASSES